MVFSRLAIRIFLTVAVGAFCCLEGFAQTRTKTRDTPLWIPLEKFDEKRDAAADIQVAVAEAKRSGRRVLLDVGGEWCVWCHRLDSLFVKNPDLNEYLHAKYVVVKVNWSKNNKNEEVLSKYPKVAGYPHLFVLDETGRLLHSQDTSELEEGKGHSREKVFAFLRTWARD